MYTSVRASIAFPIIILVASMFILQFGNAQASHLIKQIGPGSTTLLRLGLAAVVLGLVMRPKIWGWTREQWKNIVLLAATLAAMNGLFYESLARLPIGVAVTIEFLGPLTLALVSSRRRYDYLWVALGLIGIVVLSLHSHGLDGAGLDPIGILCALGAGGFWAAYILAGARYTSHNPPSGGLAGVYACGGIMLAPFGVLGLVQATPSWSLWISGIIIALFAAVFPIALEIKSLSILSPRTFSLILPLEPAIASIMGVILLSQHLTWVAAIGIGIVIVASAGAALTASPRTPLPDHQA